MVVQCIEEFKFRGIKNMGYAGIAKDGADLFRRVRGRWMGSMRSRIPFCGSMAKEVATGAHVIQGDSTSDDYDRITIKDFVGDCVWNSSG